MVTDPIYLKNWELFFQHYYGYRTCKISNYIFSFYRVTDSTYLFKNYLYKRPARAAETNEIQVLQRSGICSFLRTQRPRIYIEPVSNLEVTFLRKGFFQSSINTNYLEFL